MTEALRLIDFAEDGPCDDDLPAMQETPDYTPSRAERELVQAYIALINIGAASHGFLHDNAETLDSHTRAFLAHLRDVAGAAADRAGDSLREI